MKLAGDNKEHSVVFKVSGIQFEEILARKVGFENVALWSLEAVHLCNCCRFTMAGNWMSWS
jgi:hypothetical protein